MAEFREPRGEERQILSAGGASINGAPISYVIAWAAVLTVLAFVPIPVSAVLGIGGTFPMSQAVYALVGVILGPVGGALAAGIGRLIGVFTAPHTATVGLLSVLSAMAWAAAAGVLVQKERRTSLLAWGFFVLAYVAFVGRALSRDVPLTLALQTTATNLSGLVLWLLPVPALAREWIADQSAARLALGLALVSWIANTCGHVFGSLLQFLVNPWPANVWRFLVPIIPVEQLFRTIAGAVIGAGVIAGLRAIGLVKPTRAGY